MSKEIEGIRDMVQIRSLSGRQKGIALAASTLGLIALGVSPAIAEGSWGSYVSGGLIDPSSGFSSRWWTDNQIDSTNTAAKFISCTLTEGVAVNYLHVELYRDNGIFPDYDQGNANNYCNNAYASWGHSFPAGSFRWQLQYVTVYPSGTTSGYHANIPSLTTQY